MAFGKWFRSAPVTKGRRRAALRCESLETRETPAAFTPGNIVLYRVGAGGTLTNAATAVFLDEFTPSGTLVQSLPMPTAVSGAQLQLTASGVASSEGLLTRSVDGRYLLVPGYAANPGTLSIASSTTPSVPRVVGRIAADGTIDTSTTMGTLFSGANLRSVTSTDGVNLWAAGSNSGVVNTTFGSTVSGTTVSTSITNFRQVNIFDGQLYVTTNSGTAVRLGTVGTGLPTTAGQTVTNLNGIVPTTGSPYGFFFADLTTSVPGVDTLYVADESASALQKYSLVGGVWTSNGIIGVDADNWTGVTASVSGSTVTLYAVRSGGIGPTGGGVLVSLVDASGYNGAFAGTPTALATALIGQAYRGVALAPVDVAAVGTTTTLSAVSPLSVSTGDNVTFTGTVVAASGTALPVGTVEIRNGGSGGTLLASTTTIGGTGPNGTFSIGTTAIPAGTYSSVQAFFVPSVGFGSSASATFGSTLTVTAPGVATTTTLGTISPTTAAVGASVTFSGTVVAASGTALPVGTVEIRNGGASGTLLASTTTIGGTGPNGAFSVSSTTIPAGTYSSVQAFFVAGSGFANSNSAVFASPLNIVVGTTTAVGSITPTTGTIMTLTAPVTATSGATAPTVGSVEFRDGGPTGTLIATATSSSVSGTTRTFTVTTTTPPPGTYANVNAYYIPGAGFAASNSTAPFGSTVVVPVQTTLGVGDIAFTSIQTDNPDIFSFVLLKDVVAGTQITFTDNGWGGATNLFANTTENTLTIAFGAAYSAGTHFLISDGGTSATFTLVGSGTSVGSTLGNLSLLATAGDSILAYQGVAPNSDNATNWIAGISTNFWNPAPTTSNQTALPSALGANGVNAIALTASTTVDVDNGAYQPATFTGAIAQIRAHVNDLANWLTSDTAGPVTNTVFTVGAASVGTTTALATVSPLTVTAGGSVTFSGTVVAASGAALPVGTVEIRNGGASGTLLASTTTIGGTGPNGTFSVGTTSIPVGAYSSVQAFFVAGSGFANSNSAVFGSTLTVQATTTATIAGPATSTFGQTPAFTVTVSSGAGTPTGSVELFVDAVSVGTQTLASGVATFNVSGLAVGARSLTATYAGAGTFAGSTASAFAHTVSAASTTTSIVTQTPNPSLVGQSVAFVVTVASSAGTPTGTVTLKEGATVLGSGSLTSGSATINVSSLTAGSHSIVAEYAGVTNFAASASSTVTQTVNLNVSTTTLATPATSAFGQTITLYASVTGFAGTPTGNFTFFDGATNLGTVALFAGAATLNVSGLTVGSHSFTVSYAGDATYAASASPASPHTVSAAATTTSIVSQTPNPSLVGQSVAFVVTVASSAGTPTGTVTLKEGATVLGSGSLTAGSTTINVSSLTAGGHSIVAEYSGATNFAASASSAVTQTVNLNASATSLTAPATSTFGQTVTLSATVTGSAGSPTGSVTFFDGATNLGTVALVAGAATLNVPGLTVGSHSFTVSYAGNATYAASTSAASPHTVNAAATTTSIASQTPNPSLVGQSVAFVVTVASSAGTPSGNVTLKEGAVVLGSGSLTSGSTTINVSSLTAGSHLIVAEYAGETNFAASASPTVTQAVNASASTTTLAAPATSTFGQTITLSATVTGSAGTPTGNVTFFDGATSLGTAPLVAGVATLNVSGLTAGSHSLTAQYSGNPTYAASVSAASPHTVNAAATTTSIASQTPSPSLVGQSVAFVVTVASSAGTPTGTVTLKEGAAVLGSGSLTAGSATINVSSLTVGSHSIVAEYAGVTNFAASASPNVTQTVNLNISTTTLSAPPTSSAGQTVTLSASVTGSAGTPTGSVTFFDGATNLGTVALVAGAASLPVTGLTLGSHTFTVSYSGEAAYATSVSAATAHNVSAAAATPTIVSNTPNPSTVGQTVSFVVNVAGASGTATGTVALKLGTTTLGVGTLVGGSVTINVSSLPVGTSSIVAQYSGDTSYAPAVSAAVSQTVNGTGGSGTLVTGSLAIRRGGFSTNSFLRTASQFLDVTNTGTAPIAGPFVIQASLTSSAVTLQKAEWVTTTGLRIAVPIDATVTTQPKILVPMGLLPSLAGLGTFKLALTWYNPTATPIVYALAVFAGP